MSPTEKPRTVCAGCGAVNGAHEESCRDLDAVRARLEAALSVAIRERDEARAELAEAKSRRELIDRVPLRLRSIIRFARETWYNDGAEGETVHMLCNALESMLAKTEAERAFFRDLIAP